MTGPATDRKCYQSDLKPIWCPGCGDFAVLNALTKAFAELAVPRESIAVVSGIGCSSRLPAYLSTYGFHGVHGRVLPLATGLAVARPDLTVVAVGGDGDGFAIGGGHFLHACRRNANLLYVVMDNAVYGMTKGQASPTSAADWTEGGLTPTGPEMPPLQPLELALTAGAGFVARGFSGDPNGLADLIVAGIRHPGFAFIQTLSPCPTYRPEQMGYKRIVHPGFETTGDRRAAHVQLLEDDCFTTGLLFCDESAAAPIRPATDGDPADLAAQFRVGAGQT